MKTLEKLREELRYHQNQIALARNDEEAFEVNTKCGEVRRQIRDEARAKRLNDLSKGLDEWAAIHRLIDQKSRSGDIAWDKPRMGRGRTGFSVEGGE